MTEHVSFCRICAAACGIIVTVHDEHVERVRGDADHPVSNGYVCSKGRGLPAWHHSPGRLDRPRLRGADVSWDAVLDDLAGVVSAAITAAGPDSVALYLATGLAYDAAGQIAAATFLPSLGSSSFYTAATVDNAPVLAAAEIVAGNPMLNPVFDPTTPGLLVLVGSNPVVSHGYGTTLPDPVRKLRDFRRLGGRIVVVDPVRTETANLADNHLAVRPGSDVAVLAALCAALLEGGADTSELVSTADLDALRTALAPFTLARAADAAGIDIADLHALVADVRAHRGRLALFCGTGVTMSRDGVVAEWLRWVLLVLSGSLDRPGGMRFNRGALNRPRPGSGRAALDGPRSRPELPRVAGQLPAVALADEIEAGNIRVLFVTGGNLLTAIPEPTRMRAALAKLDALVMIDVADNELCAMATHVLPATGQLERADLSLAEHVSLRSGMQATRAVVAPVAERRPVWWMLGALSVRLGGALVGPDPDALTDELYLRGVLAHSTLDGAELFDAGPHGLDVPIEFGWVRATMLPGGRWNVAAKSMLDRLAAHVAPSTSAGLVMTPRRTMPWSNSVRFGVGDAALLRVNPADAGRLATGDAAMIASAHGEIEAIVQLDDNVRVGVVSLTHGRAGRLPGVLTSATIGVDPLTTMPQASGVPVTLRPTQRA